MTQTELNKKISTTINTWVTRMMAKFAKDCLRLGEGEARKLWREEYGLIYTKAYTVGARFRHFKKVLFKDLPTGARRALDTQKKQQLH